MSSTPRLALPYILQGQAQKELTHSQGLNRLDATVQAAVQQVGLNTPPGSPTNGQAWIVGPSPTGAWAGQANNLAFRVGGGWVFVTRFAGLMVYDIATNAQWVWDGNEWVRIGYRILTGSATYDPPNLANGAGATTTVTVTGAALGDIALATFSLSLAGLQLTAWVSAANTVSCRFENNTGAAVDLASGTLRAFVLRI